MAINRKIIWNSFVISKARKLCNFKVLKGCCKPADYGKL